MKARGAAWAMLAAAAWLAGCTSDPGQAPVLAEAYIGPATLQLRAELGARAEVVAGLKHGDRVGVIGRRRRFLKVRTEDGAEGWLDSRQLLPQQEMQALRALDERAAAGSPQGTATVFEPLNVHTAPNRQAPSFYQLTPEMKAGVITHQRAPRVPFEPPPILQQAGRPAAAAARKPNRRAKEPENAAPPRAPAPAVPEGWLAMSGRQPDPPPAPSQPAPAEAAPPLEWWTLVRAGPGRTGWVLASMLYLSIPEEVAQYAERARITSYYPLGQVTARSGDKKTIWLWTTLADRNAGHHFDGMRLFTWSTRRQRYETAYIERNIKGWLPLTPLTAAGAVTGWTVLLENRQGELRQVSYSWDGARVRVTGRAPGALPPPWYTPPGQAAPEDNGQDAEPAGAAARERLAEFLRSLRARFSQ